jgi:hypothetical protein
MLAKNKPTAARSEEGGNARHVPPLTTKGTDKDVRAYAKAISALLCLRQARKKCFILATLGYAFPEESCYDSSIVCFDIWVMILSKYRERLTFF